MLRLKRTVLWIMVASLLCGVVGAGSYWVYSDLVTVTVTDYPLSLTETHDGLSIYLSGVLLDPLGNPVSGATVEIYRTDSTGIILETLGTLTTEVDGSYALDWTAPSAGTYYFKAGYQN